MAIGANWKEVWAPVWAPVWDPTGATTEDPIGINWSPIWKQVWGPVWQTSAATGPVITSVTALSGTELSVAWTGAATEYRLDGGTAVSLPDGTSPDTISGLTPNTEYSVQLRDGAGDWSAAVSEWTDNTGGGGGGLDPYLEASESGSDSAAFTGEVSRTGDLAAVESGADAAEFIGGAVSLSGDMAASESGQDSASFVGEVVGAEPEIQPRRRRGHAAKWVKARQRMALQTWIDYLTEEEPEAETQRVIKEVKAGRPIPQTKAKGPANISAERLAEKIIPSRLWTAQNLIVDNVDVQRVVANAIRIAQERDDEEVLMLL